MPMHKLLFLFAILFFTCTACRAQTDDFDTSYHDDDKLTYNGFDTSSGSFAKDVLGDTLVNFRNYTVSRDSIEEIKNSRAYRWSKDLDSLLKDAQDHPRDGSVRITVPDKSGDIVSGPMQVILWIIAGAVVLFIIFQLFMSKGAFRTAGPKVKEQKDEEEDEANLAGKDYAYLMRKAYNEDNLRLATRWLFLMTLQKLNEKEMIAFSPDKTNSIYLAELPPAKKEEFASLALYYEYIWYGNAALSKENFSVVEGKFNDYLNRI